MEGVGKGTRYELAQKARAMLSHRSNETNMSKSRKKKPIMAMTAARSEKAFKKREHRRERADLRAAMATGRDPKEPKEFGNPALGDKDGKQYAPNYPKASRK